VPLQTQATLNINNSTTVLTGTSNGNTLAVIDSAGAVRSYSLPQLSLTMGPKTLTGSTACDITMVAVATAAVAYASTARVDYVNINTGDVTQVTTAATVTNNMQGQIAGNTVTGLCMSTRGAGVNVTQVLTTGATSLTPAQLSGTTASCICTKSDTNTWLVGTASSTILEYDQFGHLQKILPIPLTPSTGTAQTTSITSVTYSNGNMACITDRGLLYIYNWSTLTQLLKIPCWDTASVTTGGLLTQSASGVVFAAAAVGTMNPSAVMEIYLEGNNPTVVSNFWMESSIATRNIGFDGTYCWVFQNTSSDTNGRLFTVNSVAKTTTDTRTQVGGIDTNSRIIRLRDDGVGTACVEVDMNVSAGDVNVQCTNDKNYIEISIANTGTTFDIREFLG
jgi:hypothetical protein